VVRRASLGVVDRRGTCVRRGGVVMAMRLCNSTGNSNPRVILTAESRNFELLSRLLSAPVEVAGKAWDLLMRLPTNPLVESGLAALGSGAPDAAGEPATADIAWDSLLDSTSPFRLLYALQIVESMTECTDAVDGTVTVLVPAEKPAVATAGQHTDESESKTGGAADDHDLLGLNESVGAAGSSSQSAGASSAAQGSERAAVSAAAGAAAPAAPAAPRAPADAQASAAGTRTPTRDAAARGRSPDEWYSKFILCGGSQHLLQILMRWGSTFTLEAPPPPRKLSLSLSRSQSATSGLATPVASVDGAGAMIERLERQCLALLLKLVKVMLIGALSHRQPRLAVVADQDLRDDAGEEKDPGPEEPPKTTTKSSGGGSMLLGDGFDDSDQDVVMLDKNDDSSLLDIDSSPRKKRRKPDSDAIVPMPTTPPASPKSGAGQAGGTSGNAAAGTGSSGPAMTTALADIVLTGVDWEKLQDRLMMVLWNASQSSTKEDGGCRA
jgi:hypothetical protein